MPNNPLQSNKVDRLDTQLIDFRRRRITNAADAVNAQDYITKAQFDAAIAILQNQFGVIAKTPAAVATTTSATTFKMASVSWVTTPVNLSVGPAATAIQFDSVNFDSGSFYSAGSPTKLTIPTTGIYLVSYHLGPQDAGGSNIHWQSWIRVNSGATPKWGDGAAISNAATTGATALVGTALISLTAADFLEVAVVSNAGAGITWIPSTLKMSFYIMGPIPHP